MLRKRGLRLVTVAVCFTIASVGLYRPIWLTSPSAHHTSKSIPVPSPRIALCITGGARSFKCPRVHSSIKYGLADGISRGAADLKIFAVLHLDSSDDLSGIAEALDVLDVQDMQVTRKAIINSIPGCDTFAAENANSWRQNYYSQTDKQRKCFNLVKSFELSSGVKFDFIVRARPDTRWNFIFPSIQDISKEHVTVGHTGSHLLARDLLQDIQVGTGYCTNADDVCVPNDHFAVIPRRFAEIFMNSVEAHSFCGKPNDFRHCHENPQKHFDANMYAPPECILSQYLWSHGIPIDFNVSMSMELVRLDGDGQCT